MIMADTRHRTRYNYQYGSVAPDFDVATAIEEAPRKQLSRRAQKNRERAFHMNFGYVLFLTVAIALTGYILVNYLSLQSANTTASEQVASLRSEYRAMSLKNDETYERIVDSVDLTEVKRVAMVEMGMVYAGQDQIVTYESSDSDYVRQYQLIP